MRQRSYSRNVGQVPAAAALLLWVITAGIAPQARAQSTAADIVGTVKDATGAVVPGVLVRATQEETNFSRQARSNTEGIYEFRILPPGTYTIAAEAAGFKKYTNEHLALVSRQVLRVDIVMAVGTTQESVTVVAEAPPVTTDTGTVAETMGTKLLTEGPQGTPIMASWSVATSKNSLLVRDSGWVGGSYMAAGSRAGQWQTTVDGNAAESTVLAIPYSAMAEEKETVIGAPAEYRAPLTIDAVTKQGTNKFHGSVTLQYSHAALNALGPTYVGKRGPQTPSHIWNLTGGGPLYLPKVYDGRNRTFLFVSAERVTPTAGDYPVQSVPYSVPTAAMRQGQFQPYFNAINQPGKKLIDPLTGQPFPGNLIPRARWNPAAVKAIDNFYPAPNVTTANPDLPFRNANGPGYSAGSNSALVARLDQKIYHGNTATFTFTQNPSDSTFSNGPLYQTLNFGGLGYNRISSPRRLYSWSDTQIISPRIINEVRVSYFNFDGFVGNTKTVGDISSALGIDLGGDAPKLRNNLHQAPNIYITGYDRIGSVYSDSVIKQSWSQVRDNLSIQSGRHTLKFGYDQIFKKQDQPSSNAATGGYWLFDGSLSGDSMADFLLGLPTGTQRYTPSVPTFFMRFNELGLFAQDDFKPTSSLTLNVGVRMERIGPRYEQNGLYYNFDPKTGALVFPDQHSIDQIQPAFPASVKRETAAQAGFPSQLVDPSVNFSPRIGFAYRLSPKSDTVLRGSYGIFAVSAGISQKDYMTLQYTGPFALAETFINKIANGVPLVTLDHPFPSGAIGAGPATLSGNAVNPDVGVPFMQQWNLTLERRLHAQWTGRLSYVGSRQTQAGYQRNINSPPPSTIPFSPSRVVYPGFLAINYRDKGATSNYRALQAGLSHRYTSGVLVDGLFQWVNQMSDVSDNDLDNPFMKIENPYCRRCELGPADLDSLDFRANIIYDFPVGKGRMFGAIGNRFLNGVLGGWSVSTILDARNGKPDNVIFSGKDPSHTNSFGGRADVVPGCNMRSGDGKSAAYLNINCFAVPPNGRFGNSAPGVFRRPSSWDVSGSIYKYFTLYPESLRLRMNGVFNNAFNHVTWYYVNNNISSPQSFGQFNWPYGGRFTGPRTITLQAQLEW